ncbi:MAG: glycosyltransferase family 2 protein [Candidatus Aenigmatarchaeota archaeon]
MKIVGLVKFYNEEEHLERCLKCLSEICDEIVCCNDSSTDNSLSIAKKYTGYIINMPNDFENESYHKQKMLEYAISEIKDIDFFVHIDPDEIFDRYAKEGIRKLCNLAIEFNIDGFSFHVINLWKSKCWYRVDNMFNDLWKVALWKNHEGIRFDISRGLHKPQHPITLKNIKPTRLEIIHFGFSKKEYIMRKYNTYKALGMSGWALNRIIDESRLILKPVNLEIFPDWIYVEADEYDGNDRNTNI